MVMLALAASFFLPKILRDSPNFIRPAREHFRSVRDYADVNGRIDDVVHQLELANTISSVRPRKTTLPQDGTWPFEVSSKYAANHRHAFRGTCLEQRLAPAFFPFKRMEQRASKAAGWTLPNRLRCMARKLSRRWGRQRQGLHHVQRC
jgi:hypothetical protein